MRYLGFFLFLLLSASVNAQTCPNWVAKAISIQGTVEQRVKNDTSGQRWTEVKRGQPFCASDIVRVKNNSRAAFILTNDTILRLDQKSTITFANISASSASTLSLSKGIAHFISRVKQAFEVVTPFVNAAVEGTEFVVAVNETQSQVTVFEGKVRVSNGQGEVLLTKNQSASALKGQAPLLQIIVKPRDAVQWALYYPIIIDMNVSTDMNTELLTAARNLANGRVKEALQSINQVLEAEPEQPDALALKAIITLVTHDKAHALTLVSKALESDSENISALLAMSYVQQAHFNIEEALNTLSNHSITNALVYARLSELYLMLGQLDEALEQAKEAVALNDKLAKTQSVLGFSHLTQINIDQAKDAFNKAIVLDQTEPLAHLGLGLALIRDGELVQGRREIEYAASLDPNNSLIRSYLGKAYYEEKRNNIASSQFDIAKELDPLDPTPWLYSAILKHSENKTVAAYENILESIKLNDNRAVYRSKLQLDQDIAARSVSLANIYQDLGFEQLAINEATVSLSEDPNNYSAHRFLADVYAKLPRHEIALLSELWQSQLNQSAIINPPKPQRLSTAANIIYDTELSIGQNEYSTLLYQDGIKATIDSSVGSNSTKYNNLAVSGKHGINSYSISKFNYETEGYRVNNDFEQDLLNLSAQSNITDKDKILFSYTTDKTIEGDIKQSIIPNNELTLRRFEKDNKINQLAYSHQYSLSNHLFISASHQSDSILLTDMSTTNFAPGVNLIDNLMQTFNDSSDTLEGKFNGTVSDSLKYSIGLRNYSQRTLENEDTTSDLVIDGVGTFPQIPINTSLDYKIHHKNLYLYTRFQSTPNHVFYLGLSADDYSSNKITAIYKKTSVNPKLGYRYKINNDSQFRIAAFKVLKRALIGNQTIEPTQIAGFNQFYDDLNGSISTKHSLAFDHKYNNDLNVGIELSKRTIDSPAEITTVGSKSIARLSNRYENIFKTYIYWIVNPNISINIFPNIEEQRRSFITGAADSTRANKINTTSIPINIKYTNHSGISVSFTSTHIEQYVEFPALSGSTDYNSEAWITDLSASYKLPKRHGSIGVTVRNLADKNTLFHAQGLDGQDRPYTVIPETTYFLNIILNF